MSAEFGGLVAVVTGGGSGIGLATATAFVERGATVAVIDREAGMAGGQFAVFIADVTDRTSVDIAVRDIETRFGGIDILVNNAGISAVGTIADNTDAEWARVLDVNVTGIARVTAAVLPALRRSAHAAVVNVSSIAALNGLQERALYSASKGAVLSMTFAMATDHVREGIRVNAVRPGTVASPFVERMLRSFPDPMAERAALDARQATGRMVTPEEVADAILYLASPRSGSTTGTALDVDGGVTHLRVRPKI